MSYKKIWISDEDYKRIKDMIKDKDITFQEYINSLIEKDKEECDKNDTE